MEPIEFVPIPPTNKHSIISLVLGILTLLMLCGSMMPFPFTGFICFPASFLFGVLSLIYGVVSLRSMRTSNESGRPMAWIGILVGGFVILCLLCSAVLLAYFFMYHPNTIQLPPIFDKYQI